MNKIKSRLLPSTLLNFSILTDHKQDISLSDYITTQFHEIKIRRSSVFTNKGDIFRKLGLKNEYAKIGVLRSNNRGTLEIGIIYTEKKPTDIEVRHAVYIDTGRNLEKISERFNKIFKKQKELSDKMNKTNEEKDKANRKKGMKEFKRGFNHIEQELKKVITEMQVNILGDFMGLMIGDFNNTKLRGILIDGVDVITQRIEDEIREINVKFSNFVLLQLEELKFVLISLITGYISGCNDNRAMRDILETGFEPFAFSNYINFNKICEFIEGKFKEVQSQI